jgi:hypothetical protein
VPTTQIWPRFWYTLVGHEGGQSRECRSAPETGRLRPIQNNSGLPQGRKGDTRDAKIGELTLENDFLEGALSKAGLLSAKR